MIGASALGLSATTDLKRVPKPPARIRTGIFESGFVMQPREQQQEIGLHSVRYLRERHANL